PVPSVPPIETMGPPSATGARERRPDPPPAFTDSKIFREHNFPIHPFIRMGSATIFIFKTSQLNEACDMIFAINVPKAGGPVISREKPGDAG
ncbi:MAG: hypothetical protein JXE07_05165, partial [Candidatus Aminicenantes bacterium]|nr:hypothetical protein [Candidatus Aminicenantes bacterium]